MVLFWTARRGARARRPQAYGTWKARADGDVSFLSRREATRRESPARGGAAAPGQPKKFRN